MDEKMYHLRKSFPDECETIAFLMAEDPEFRTICEDYNDCVQVCDYWNRSKAPEAETRVHEYRNLIKELENEIVEFLQLLRK
jgi:uncharacterized protein YdcH (DUF465 family)